MSHPAYYNPTVVSATPSRRLNTLAARAQAVGLHTALYRTVDGSNGYTEQYSLRITVPFPGLHYMEILATRSKTRRPLRPWHFYLTYMVKGETKATRYMRRWHAPTVEYFYAETRHAQLLTSIALTLASRA